MKPDLFYKIALSMIPGIGGILARNLILHTGGVEQIFSESYQSLMKIPGIGEVNARRIKNKSVFVEAEKEMAFIGKYKIKAMFYTDDEYPVRLKSCVDAPIILYARGNMNLNGSRAVSIVGTRNATSYGKKICEQLISDFYKRNYNILIISGLAYGIDVHAHKLAMKYGLPTIGVLGHGLDKIYPSLHSETARKMLARGGLVTDFPSGTRIDPSNFIRRNRIIAGLSDATIVVESAVKGGALITADIASSYNRDVFAFPGRIDDIYSKGCNKLILMNGASLIQDIDDIEYFMGWETTCLEKPLQKELFTNLTPEEDRIVELLRKEKKLFIDQLSDKMKMPGRRVSAILMNLELKNVLIALPGKMYTLR
ncbi:MAG: DNA-processing protein DprA [Prolixibacteraceae bacterium]|nr:DNA-processing protein DprA [Prolixibacteraceae bacterium]